MDTTNTSQGINSRLVFRNGSLLFANNEEVARLLHAAADELKNHEIAVQCERNRIAELQGVVTKLEALQQYIARADERRQRLQRLVVKEHEYSVPVAVDEAAALELQSRLNDVKNLISSSERKLVELEGTVAFLKDDVELLEGMRGAHTSRVFAEAARKPDKPAPPHRSTRMTKLDF